MAMTTTRGDLAFYDNSEAYIISLLFLATLCSLNSLSR